MAKSRPFAYNPGSQIPGTQKFGNLTVGSHDLTPDQSGVQWWNGPDEDLGYVIAETNVDGLGNPLQPTQIPNVYGSVGFFRTDGKNTTAFINLTNAVSGQNFTTATQCKTWLESNNRWTSWGDFATEAIVAFKTRVLSSSGNFEAENNLESQLNTLGSTLFDSASLVITPNAYKEQTLYSIKPDKVGNNLLQWSEQFDNSYWRKVSCSIVPNQEIAPDGTLTADYVVEDNTTGLRYLGVLGVPTSIGQTYTFSVFVKKKDRSQIMFQINEGNSLYPTVVFDFDSQVFTRTTSLLTSSFQSIGNGWFRIILTRTPTTGTSSVIGIQPININGQYSATGDGVSRTIIWGAQLELGSTATDYISTTDRAIINGTIGDLTVTRATTATRVNEQGLIETVPYNLITYSEEFENSQWAKSNVTIAQNSIISPNGDMTGDKLIEGTNNGLKYITSTNSGTVGNIHTASIYLKANTRTWAYLTFGWDGQGDRAAYFNLIDGIVGNLEGGVTASIVAAGNGWYRCTITGTMLNNAPRLSVSMATGNGTRSYLGDGVSSIYAWGAQLVNGTEPKPYQLTTNRLNVPRIDYTAGSPSILVEPQRTNLFTYSEDFSNGAWFKLSTTINSNTIVAPDGNLSADGIYPNNGVNINYPASGLYTSGTYSYLQKSAGVLSVGTYTFSFFIKKNNLRYIQPRVSTDSTLALPTGTVTYNILDLQNKTIYFNDGLSTVKIKDYSNDFVRYEITFDVSTSATYYLGFWYWKETSGVTDGTLGYNIWGAQLEAGSNATSYIPTTTSSVTRNADVISNTNAITLIGQTEGSMYVEFNNTPYVTSGGGFRWLLSIRDPLTNNFLKIYRNTGLNVVNRVGMEFHNGTFVLNLFSPSNTYNMPLGRNKVLVTYQNGLYKLFQNGALRTTVSNSLTVPTNMSRVDVGSFVENQSANLNDGVYTAALYKTVLTDTQAIQLTTL